MKLNEMVDDVRLFYPQKDREWNYSRASDAAQFGESQFREYAELATLPEKDKAKSLALSEFFQRSLEKINKGYKDGAWRQIPKEVGTDLDLPINDMLHKIRPKGDLLGADYARERLLMMLKHVRDVELSVAQLEKEKESHALNPEGGSGDLARMMITAILPWALAIVLALRITKITWELTERQKG